MQANKILGVSANTNKESLIRLFGYLRKPGGGRGIIMWSSHQWRAVFPLPTSPISLKILFTLGSFPTLLLPASPLASMLSVFLYVLLAVLGAAIFSGISFWSARANPWVLTMPHCDGKPVPPDREDPPPLPVSPIGTRVTGCYGRKHTSSPPHPSVPSDKNLAFIIWPTLWLFGGFTRKYCLFLFILYLYCIYSWNSRRSDVVLSRILTMWLEGVSFLN